MRRSSSVHRQVSRRGGAFPRRAAGLCPARRAHVRSRAHGCGVRSARNCSVPAPVVEPDVLVRAAVWRAAAWNGSSSACSAVLGTCRREQQERGPPAQHPCHRLRGMKKPSNADVLAPPDCPAPSVSTPDRVTVNARADTQAASRASARETRAVHPRVRGGQTRRALTCRDRRDDEAPGGAAPCQAGAAPRIEADDAPPDVRT